MGGVSVTVRLKHRIKETGGDKERDRERQADTHAHTQTHTDTHRHTDGMGTTEATWVSSEQEILILILLK